MAVDIKKWARSPDGRRFHYYDPYLTYSNQNNDCFIGSKGKPERELNPDTKALFELGKAAFKRLIDNGEHNNRKEFDEGYASYWAILDDFREVISDLYAKGKLFPKDSNGCSLTVDINELDDAQIASICWQMYLAPWNKSNSDEGIRRLYEKLFLFHALREIDNALIGVALGGCEAVVAAIEAANALSNAVAIQSNNEHLAEARSRLGYEAAIEKLRRDPKQREKAFVRECWDSWQQKPSAYKGKAAFARDMLSKCEHLESVKKIEDWCRTWEAEGKE